MQIDVLARKVAEKQIENTQIYRNPENLSQWLVRVNTIDQGAQLLIDANDKPLTKLSIEGMMSILIQAGLSSSEIMF